MTTQGPPATPPQRKLSEGKKELGTALAVLAFAIGGFLFINPMDSGVYPGPGGMTWQTMPFFYSGALACLALIYIIQALVQIRREARIAPPALDTVQEAEDRIVLFRRVVTLALLLVYVGLLRVFGFAILTPLFLFALFRLYKRGPAGGDAIIALVGGFILWILFIRILHLNLKGAVFDPFTPFLLQAFAWAGL